MIKSILKLNGVQELSKSKQISVLGGATQVVHVLCSNGDHHTYRVHSGEGAVDLVSACGRGKTTQVWIQD